MVTGPLIYILMTAIILHFIYLEEGRYSLQGARTSVSTFGKLMNILLGLISSPKPEPSLLHVKTSKDFASLAFYINDIFRAFKTY